MLSAVITLVAVSGNPFLQSAETKEGEKMNRWLERLRQVKANRKQEAIIQIQQVVKLAKADNIFDKPIISPTSGVYIRTVHGPPESRDIKEWQKLHRQAIKGTHKAIKDNKQREASRHFQDACYFASCARLLKVKDTEKFRYRYIVENMQYSNIGSGNNGKKPMREVQA